MKDTQFAKFVVLFNGLVPGAIVAWEWFTDRAQLGVNAVESVLHTTGLLALIFLLLSLSITPVRKVTGWNWLSHFLRMLGLFAFFYGVIHFLIYFGLNRSWSISGVIADTLQRNFILFGMAALLILIPLAGTSFNGIIKRMGGKNWKRLHSLVYIAGVAAVIHYCMVGKLLSTQQIIFAIVLAILLGYRIAEKYFPALRYKRKVVVAGRSEATSSRL